MKRYKVTNSPWSYDTKGEALSKAHEIEREGSGIEFEVIDTKTWKAVYHSIGY